MSVTDTSLFSLLVLSLSNATLIGLGYELDPVNGKLQKNLEMARENIELLEMLEIKTKGNLNNDEKRILEDILYDIRLKYLEALKT